MDVAISLRTAAGGVASIALSYNAVVGISDYVVIAGDETFVIDGARVRNAKGVLFEADERAAEADAVVAQDAAFVAAVSGGPAFAAEARLILPALRVQDAVARSS